MKKSSEWIRALSLDPGEWCCRSTGHFCSLSWPEGTFIFGNQEQEQWPARMGLAGHAASEDLGNLATQEDIVPALSSQLPWKSSFCFQASQVLGKQYYYGTRYTYYYYRVYFHMLRKHERKKFILKRISFFFFTSLYSTLRIKLEFLFGFFFTLCKS